MRLQSARVALAAGNFVLTVVLLSMGYVIVCPRQLLPERILGWLRPEADATVPAFKPVKLKLPDQPDAKDRVKDYEVVWREVDRPPPETPPTIETPPREIAEKFKVVLVVEGRAMLVPASGGEQLLVLAGEPLPGPFDRYRCLGVDEVSAVVTLETPGHEKSAFTLEAPR